MKSNNEVRWYDFPASVGDWWVLDSKPYVVVRCQRIMFWYRITFKPDFFREGET